MTFDVDYFIKKFEAIPHDKWTTGDYGDNLGRKCALGHCADWTTGEGRDLQELFLNRRLRVTDVNDGKDPEYNFHGSHPKNRVLAVLRDIKEGRI